MNLSHSKILFISFIGTHIFTSCRTRPEVISQAKVATTEAATETPKDVEYQKWLEKYAPKDETDFVSCPSTCQQINVYVELPMDKKDDNIGHTAIAIGEDFYDFGPSNAKDGAVLSSKSMCTGKVIFQCEGSRWWANRFKQIKRGGKYEMLFPDASKHSQITKKMVMDNLSIVAGDFPVMEVPICVTEHAGMVIREWWQRFERNRPLYEVPGAQCTSTVYASLLKANLYRTDSVRDQKPGVIGTFQGGSISPFKFSRMIMETPETIFDQRMLCGGQKMPFKARQIN